MGCGIQDGDVELKVETSKVTVEVFYRELNS